MKKLGLLFASASIVITAAAAPTQAQLGLEGGQAQPVIPPGTAGRLGSQGPDAEAGPAQRATVAQIMENPRAYAGKNVIVTSLVEEIFTPWTFKLDEQQLRAAGIDSDMLVIGKVPQLLVMKKRNLFVS